jgi:hypothetical protein
MAEIIAGSTASFRYHGKPNADLVRLASAPSCETAARRSSLFCARRCIRHAGKHERKPGVIMRFAVPGCVALRRVTVAEAVIIRRAAGA